jgi:hypothetical protein
MTFTLTLISLCMKRPRSKTMFKKLFNGERSSASEILFPSFVRSILPLYADYTSQNSFLWILVARAYNLHVFYFPNSELPQYTYSLATRRCLFTKFAGITIF